MKLNLYLVLFAFVSALSLQSCDNDHDNDDDIRAVSPELRKAFSEKFPHATRVEWEREGAYYVADFYTNNDETSAWFTPDNKWYKTETDYADLTTAAIPDLVKSAFAQSEYATWRVDDVDRIERVDAATVYLIEVEQKGKDVYLRYSSEGIPVR